MKKDMKAPRIEYRYCSAQAGNPRVERIRVTFQMSLIPATSLSDSKLSECVVQTVWHQKILKQKIADLVDKSPLGLQTIKCTLSKIKYLGRVVWFICAHMVHTVSFQIYNWRQNCWDTFLKRGVLSYPEKGSPHSPRLTLLGRLRVPTNLKASGTTLNRGSGERVPLKGISHLFK